MTNIAAIHKLQNQAVFELFEQTQFNPNSIETVDGIKLDLTETADDVVMLVGDDIEVDAKDGNNTVLLSGSNNKITASNGNNLIEARGDNSKVSLGNGNNLIYIEGDNTNTTVGNGTNIGRLYGDNGTYTAGTGKNEFGFLGNNNTVEIAGNYAQVGYYGDNNKIKVGGGSYVGTMDFALLHNKNFADMEEAWVSSLSHFNNSFKVQKSLTFDYSRCSNPLYDGMSDEDKAFAETVDLAEMKEGKPKYVIAADANGQPIIYVYSYTYEGKSYYYPRGKEGQQEFKVMIRDVEEMNVKYDSYDDYTMVYNKNYEIEGVKGNVVEFENNSDALNTYEYTAQGGVQTAPNFNGASNIKLKQETYNIFAEQSAHDFLRHDVVDRKFYTSKA